MKMKLLLLLFCALVLFTFSHCTRDNNVMSQKRFIFFYELLHRVEQPLAFKNWIQKGASLNLNRTLYTTWTEPMEDFYQATLRQQLLPKDTAFYGELVKSQRQQTLGLYQFLSKSKAWEIFVENACWARQHTHPHMFVHALEMAAVSRYYENVDLLPPIYEILPQYFFDSKFVKDAMEFKPSNLIAPPTEYTETTIYTKPWQWWKELKLSDEHWYAMENETNAWFRPNDYTRNSPLTDGQQRTTHSALSYLTEDADWCAYWYYVNIQYGYPLESTKPPWTEPIIGEHWFHFLSQYLARYYMERLSQGFGDIPDFDWEQAIREGYDPMLTAAYGKKFSVRPVNWIPARAAAESNGYLMEVRETLNYIRSIIDSGTYTMRNGTIVDLRQPESLVHLHNLLRGHRDPTGSFIPSEWYILAHMFFAGVGKNESQLLPNVLLNFETMPREPFFYVFHGEILKLRQHFDAQLPAYTSAELHVPGIDVIDVNVTELVTYDQIFNYNVSNLLQANLGHQLFARRLRLNHQPFNITVRIQHKRSNYNYNLFLHFYLAPKFDEFGRLLKLNENRNNFIQLTNIRVPVRPGINNFKFSYEKLFLQKCSNNYFQTKMYHSAWSDDWDKRLEFSMDLRHKHCGFDARLLLPHGWTNGLPMQLFVMATEDDGIKMNEQLWWQPFIDHYGQISLGYPFNRPIPNEQKFFGSNMFLKDVKIYHKE